MRFSSLLACAWLAVASTWVTGCSSSSGDTRGATDSGSVYDGPYYDVYTGRPDSTSADTTPDATPDAVADSAIDGGADAAPETEGDVGTDAAAEAEAEADVVSDDAGAGD
jgi:hypothetical protein